MEILVTGGTGYIGTRLCTALADRGHNVTALSRTPRETELPEAVTLYQGDVTDYASIEPAFEEKDAVVNLVALSPLYTPRGGNRMHDIVHRGGTENAVRAAVEHDVDRFVQMSGIHADPDGPTAYLRAKGKAEDIVRDSPLDWTILRPTIAFGEGGELVGFIKKVAPPYVTPLPAGGRTRMQIIWVEDFIPMVADATDKPEHIEQLYHIGGPEPLTLAEITRLVHAADGRSSTVIPIPMALAGVGLTLAGFVPGIPFDRDQYRGLQLDLVVPRNDVVAFGVEPTAMTTFREYLLGPHSISSKV